MIFPALVLAAAVSIPSPAPAATVPQIPAAITARAIDWLHRLAVGKIDRSQLTTEVNAQLTDAVAKSMEQKLGPLGDSLGFSPADVQHNKGQTAYIYKVDYAHDTTLFFFFVLDDSSGKISGLRFSNAQ
jgi:hypothetical protein